MDLVDEENTSARHRGEEAGKVARLLDRRAARGANLGTHGVAEDVGEGRLAESRRTAQQDMLKRFVTLASRLHEKHETLDGLRLPAELLEHRGPQRDIERGVGRLGIDGEIFGIHERASSKAARPARIPLGSRRRDVPTRAA